MYDKLTLTTSKIHAESNFNQTEETAATLESVLLLVRLYNKLPFVINSKSV